MEYIRLFLIALAAALVRAADTSDKGAAILLPLKGLYEAFPNVINYADAEMTTTIENVFDGTYERYAEDFFKRVNFEGSQTDLVGERLRLYFDQQKKAMGRTGGLVAAKVDAYVAGRLSSAISGLQDDKITKEIKQTVFEAIYTGTIILHREQLKQKLENSEENPAHVAVELCTTAEAELVLKCYDVLEDKNAESSNLVFQVCDMMVDKDFKDDEQGQQYLNLSFNILHVEGFSVAYRSLYSEDTSGCESELEVDRVLLPAVEKIFAEKGKVDSVGVRLQTYMEEISQRISYTVNWIKQQIKVFGEQSGLDRKRCNLLAQAHVMVFNVMFEKMHPDKVKDKRSKSVLRKRNNKKLGRKKRKNKSI